MHSHKKMGEIAPGVLPKGAKTCFVFFCFQCTYPTPISTIFETKDMNRFLSVYSGENLCISERGFSRYQRQLKWVLLMVGCFCRQYSLNATILAIGIISGASRHPIDVPLHVSFGGGRTVWAL